jgi:hypothetical protein
LFDHLAAYYARLCTTLEQEFGAPPDPVTEQLYEQLVAKQRVP